MSVYRSFSEIDYNPNTVLTVGTFDGVHKGHQLIIKELLEAAKEESSRALIITIHPHPQIVLQKENLKPIKLLSTIDERIKLLKYFGVNDILVIPFTKEFSETKPEDFVIKYLVDKIGLRKVLIGYDHLFGKNRGGDENLLYNLGNEYNFKIQKLGPLSDKELPISSTKIRNSILNFDLETANQMLGYSYFIEGEVIVGEKIGAKLGFPTANIKLPDENKLLPPNGVYIVSSDIDGKKVWGMSNIGYRPTFNNEKRISFEVNFFDFSDNIYGKELTIHFLKFLRFEQKFAGVEELIIQLEKDKIKAKDYIKTIF